MPGPSSDEPSAEYEKPREKLPMEARSSGSMSEKEDMEVQVSELNAADIGDVFTEGPRLIDLGEDGKERPIGAFLPISFLSL